MSQAPPPINESEEPWPLYSVRQIITAQNSNAHDFTFDGENVSWKEPHPQYPNQTKTWRNVVCTSGPVPPPDIITIRD